MPIAVPGTVASGWAGLTLICAAGLAAGGRAAAGCSGRAGGGGQADRWY